MKKKLWIAAGIALLVVALVCVVVLATAPMREEARVQRYYVNQVYFLLVDIAKELETSEPAAPSTELQKLLVALDTNCNDVALTVDDKWYIFSFSFTDVAYNIQQEEYEEWELKELAAYLREVIGRLSDETGTHPRRNVSYDELGMLLVPFAECGRR